MVKFISKKDLIELLSQIDIAYILALFINLKKKYNGYLSHCPFHTEKTPSFFVSEKKQKYYCFGCHRSGNVISFLMTYNSMTFIESVNFLLNKLGYKSNNVIQKNFSMYNLVDNVSDLYHKNLITHFNNNYTLLYFLNKRKLNKNIIKKFQLGLADNSWHFLSKNIKEFKKIEIELESVGLIIKKKNIKYDRFRNRIIFPIRDINGKKLGFGARTLNDKIKPKYINSPESKIFSKKNELYGIYESRIDKKTYDHVIIVEGYLDVISLHKYNITNVVAILGTAFNKNHFKLLKTLYNKIIFCFDGDLAGQNALIRAAHTCLSYIDLNIFIGFVLLPEKYDPDLYINKFGKEAFINKIMKPTYILDYFYNIISLNLNLAILHNKIFFANELYGIIKRINNPFSKKFILDYFVTRLIKYNDILKLKSINNEKNCIKKNIGMKACAFILKKRNLVNKVNIKKLILNKNIKFKSDLNTFLELSLVLKKNINIKFYYLKKKMLGKIYIDENVFSSLSFYKKNDMFIDEFSRILNEIYSFGK